MGTHHHITGVLPLVILASIVLIGRTDPTVFQEDALLAHNQFREKHRAPPLKLSKDLNALAQRWADHLASINSLQHSSNDVGENLAMFGGRTDYSGREVSAMWYSEVENYNFGSSGFQSGTGHFSQVVWKDSKELGIGKAVASNGNVYVVANYLPRGNILTKFASNVFAPVTK